MDVIKAVFHTASADDDGDYMIRNFHFPLEILKPWKVIKNDDRFKINNARESQSTFKRIKKHTNVQHNKTNCFLINL